MLERLFPQQADDRLFVEDVFSTYLYTGTGSAQTITNGIDLAGKGGLIWSKGRSGTSGAQRHNLFDTARGKGSFLSSNSTNEQFTFTSDTQDLTSFNSNGFSVGIPYNANVNQSSTNYATWTFRKAPKFFDVVTYTGDGTSQRLLNHSLGVAPGFIVVKRLDTTSNWWTYHRGVAGSINGYLNLTDAFSSTGYLNVGNIIFGQDPASIFRVFNSGSGNDLNVSGATYVAYLFAHDPSADGIIQCGSYTAGSSPVVTLGWEPQWLMIKNATVGGTFLDWYMFDNMRKLDVSNSGNAPLRANTADAEGGTYATSGYNLVQPTATGFIVDPSGAAPSGVNNGNNAYIYMAIRRGPMRTPTLGTSVFSPVANSSAIDASTPVSLVPPASDLWLSSNLSGAAPYWQTRLMGWAWMRSSSTSVQDTSYTWTQRTQSDLLPSGGWWSAGTSQVNYFFKRAPGFFDVVCYTGTGVARTITHNLGVAPELIIVKARTNGGTIAPDWTARVPALGATSTVFLNLTGAAVDYQGYVWNNSNPTSTGVNLSADNYLTNSATGSTYVMYLFASVPGVSKVGTYTGNGSSQTINCAFTTGARFVMIKRTDSTGDWYVWDSARGIVAGNDPYLALNSTAAEVTSNDSVDPDSTGFIVNQVAASNINVNGATYIFLSIA
jgi:hypothetical protein